MQLGTLISEYLLWHYGSSIHEMISIWKDIMWFWYNFFSMPILLKTLVLPFHKVHLKTERKMLDIEDIVGTFLINTIMRAVGFFLRLIILSIGVLFELVSLALGPIALIAWLFLPFLSITIALTGILMLVP